MILVLLPLASCAPKPTGSALDRLRARGFARVGYANEAPFAYMDSSQRRLTGEAPEIARVVLAQMGIKRVEGVLTEFGTLIPGLKARRFDLIAAGMYITPLRCRQVAFSNPTYAIGEGFLVAPGNPRNLHSYEDLANDPAARLGVVAGSIERRYARKTNVPDGRLAIFPDAPSALEGVHSGRIDAYACTTLTAGDLLQRVASGRVEMAEPFRQPVVDGQVAVGYGAFAFHRGDSELVAEFNKHLKAFLGTPEHLRLVQPFGFSEATLPGDVTAEQLCGGAPSP
jgi:polar amino acid transport system substrate-binding protein